MLPFCKLIHVIYYEYIFYILFAEIKKKPRVTICAPGGIYIEIVISTSNRKTIVLYFSALPRKVKRFHPVLLDKPS